MSESDFLAQWDLQLAGFCIQDLMPDGEEAALLMPLAASPRAATLLVRHAARSSDYRQRKLAAILAGFIQDPLPGLLDELFEQESERNALALPETTEPLCSQSVVEDIVLAASRWCRREVLREPAFALLRKVVARTLIGEYWSTACYALTTLCRYEAPGVDELLQSFAAFARSSPPEHPLRPSLGTEREFIRGLLARHRETLDAIEAILDREQEAAEQVEFEEETEAAVTAFLAAARKIG